MRHLFVDTETSGLFVLNGKCVVLTWSAIITENLNELDRLTVKSQFNPDTDVWDDSAQKVHGIPRQEAMTYSHKTDAADQIIDFMSQYSTNKPITWVEHSMRWFDWSATWDLIANTSRFKDFLDLVSTDHRISTIHMGKKAGYSINRLDAWAKRLNLKLDHHNSMSDAQACMDIYKHLVDRQLFN